MKILFMILNFFVASAYAETTFSPRCPDDIKVTQKIDNNYPEWRAFSQASRHYLDGISMYSGKPEELAQLVPEKMSQHLQITVPYFDTCFEIP